MAHVIACTHASLSVSPAGSVAWRAGRSMRGVDPWTDRPKSLVVLPRGLGLIAPASAQRTCGMINQASRTE